VRLLALVALALALSGSAAAGERPNAADLEAELVCPACGTTLDQSDSLVARRMKAYIRQWIAAGATKEQIKTRLVDEFGPRVLATPPKEGFDLLAWVLPLGGLAVGVVAVGALALVWSRRRDDDAEDPAARADPELERRLDEELARFDA
jgi:cytochrome c-type biogenesis protein CcmH